MIKTDTMGNDNINQQVTDAVMQSSVKVIAESPPIALGSIYQSMVHSTAVLYQNAVNAQNQQNILGRAATTQGIMQIYSMDTTADSFAVAHI